MYRVTVTVVSWREHVATRLRELGSGSNPSRRRTSFARKIGFIGLGAMGKSISKNLIRAGHELAVYNVAEPPFRELEKLGARPVSSSKP